MSSKIEVFTLDDARAVLDEDGFDAADVKDVLSGDPEAPEPEVAGTSPSSRDVASSGLTGVNRGIAESLGAPVDMVNSLLSKIGLGSDRPIGGSAQISELFKSLGFIQPVTNQFAERVGQTVGGGASALAPLLGFSSRIPGAIGQFLQSVRQRAATGPATFIGGELVGSTAAGAGGATAEQVFPNNPAAEMMGELLGGTVPGVLAFTPARVALKAIRASVTPFTAAGARDRAEQRIREIVGDPTAASENMETMAGLGLSGAQASKDPGLMALEQAVVQSNSQLRAKFEQQAALTNRLLQQSLKDVADDGSIADTRDLLTQRREYLLRLMEANTANRVAIAQQRMEAARPRMNRQQANMILREELEKALEAARAQEKQLWNAVPKGVTVSNAITRETLENILTARGVVEKEFETDDIPGFVTTLVGRLDDKGIFKPGKLGEATTVKELHNLRSHILDEMRAERAKPAPNRRKIGILDDIQEAILTDLGANAPNDEVGALYREALDFSRSVNERFTRGTVGSLLGYERRGGPSIAPELTAERTLAGGGPRAGANLEALLTAANTPEAQGAVADFMRNLFVTQATDRNGKVVPAAAQRFLEKHSSVLNRFPELQKSLSDASTAQRIAQETAARMDVRSASLRDKKLSRAALFLEAPIGREIDAVLRNGNPRAAISELVRMVRRDPTGDALSGLKAGYVDNLIERTMTSNFDAEGNPFLSGRRMMKLIHDELPIMQELFGAREIAAIQRVAQGAAALETSLKTAPLDKIIDDTPNMLYALMARVTGANLGAKFGAASGAQLAAASAGSRFVRAITERLSADRAKQLLIDAVTTDPDLLRALVADASTPRRREFVQKRLNAWLATTGERAFDGTDDEKPE